MATSGIVADKQSKLDCRELMISTSKITKAGIGGPLIDFDGNFVGMNFYGMEETHYLPRNEILELLRHLKGLLLLRLSTTTQTDGLCPSHVGLILLWYAGAGHAEYSNEMSSSCISSPEPANLVVKALSNFSYWIVISMPT